METHKLIVSFCAKVFFSVENAGWSLWRRRTHALPPEWGWRSAPIWGGGMLAPKMPLHGGADVKLKQSFWQKQPFCRRNTSGFAACTCGISTIHITVQAKQEFLFPSVWILGRFLSFLINFYLFSNRETQKDCCRRKVTSHHPFSLLWLFFLLWLLSSQRALRASWSPNSIDIAGQSATRAPAGPLGLKVTFSTR